MFEERAASASRLASLSLSEVDGKNMAAVLGGCTVTIRERRCCLSQLVQTTGDEVFLAAGGPSAGSPTSSPPALGYGYVLQGDG